MGGTSCCRLATIPWSLGTVVLMRQAKVGFAPYIMPVKALGCDDGDDRNIITIRVRKKEKRLEK